MSDNDDDYIPIKKKHQSSNLILKGKEKTQLSSDDDYNNNNINNNINDSYEYYSVTRELNSDLKSSLQKRNKLRKKYENYRTKVNGKKLFRCDQFNCEYQTKETEQFDSHMNKHFNLKPHKFPYPNCKMSYS